MRPVPGGNANQINKEKHKNPLFSMFYVFMYNNRKIIKIDNCPLKIVNHYKYIIIVYIFILSNPPDDMTTSLIHANDNKANFFLTAQIF